MAMEAVNQNPAVSTSGIYQITLSADPSVAPGKAAPPGTTAKYGTSYYDKWGPDDTDWVNVSSSRSMVIVDQQTLAAAATSITFSGLDGDAHRAYFLDIHVIAGHAGGSAGITINGWNHDSWVYTGGYSALENNLLAGLAVGAYAFMRYYVQTNSTGGHRAHGVGARTNAAYMGVASKAGGANLTSLVIDGNIADTFGVGTVATIYRYKDIV
jgi:hypothetical protein